MRVELLFPSKYLCAADLIENGGKDVTLTIKRVFQDDLRTNDGKTTKKALIEFERAQKMLVGNKTNFYIIADLYGPETDKWVGKRVTLFPTRVQAFGKMVDAIRIRPEQPRDGTKKSRSQPEQSKRGDTHEEEYDPNTGEVIPPSVGVAI